MDDPSDRTTKTVSPLIGTKLAGQYTISGIIGEGGMGMIYRGRQDIVDREVAIKILSESSTKDDINVQRLAREAKALGKLSHANIVTTYDYGFTDKKEPYIVFEFVDGESLQAYLTRRVALPYRECVPFFIQLADAIKYAHANGIVHRDLKPHNIMVIEKDGKTSIKLLDFGIAQVKSESQKLTRAGEIWGSPNYMSPEQCVGDPVDHLTDIYSLGVVMYKTLSGQLPFSGKSFAETVNKKLNEPVRFFSSLNLPEEFAVPEYLEEIVIRCLRRYPDERYQSMADVKMALVAFAKGEGIYDDSLSGNYGEGKTGGETIALDRSTMEKLKEAGRVNRNSSSKTEKVVPTKTGSTSSARNKKTEVVVKENKLKPFLLPLIALAIIGIIMAVSMIAGVELESNILKKRNAATNANSNFTQTPADTPVENQPKPPVQTPPVVPPATPPVTQPVTPPVTESVTPPVTPPVVKPVEKNVTPPAKRPAAVLPSTNYYVPVGDVMDNPFKYPRHLGPAKLEKSLPVVPIVVPPINGESKKTKAEAAKKKEQHKHAEKTNEHKERPVAEHSKNYSRSSGPDNSSFDAGYHTHRYSGDRYGNGFYDQFGGANSR